MLIDGLTKLKALICETIVPTVIFFKDQQVEL